jgi:hypothetical protein
LVEQALREDAVAIPAYEMGGVEEKQIRSHSRRDQLDNWLNEPMGLEAEYQAAVMQYLTS